MTRLMYERLRVRLRRQPRLGEKDTLWGKQLSLTAWTVFEPHEFRDGRWMGLAWEFVRREELLRIEGKLAGRWEPVSTWLMQQRRRTASGTRPMSEANRPIRKAKSIQEIRECMALSTGRKPGRGELAFHLLDHVGMSGEETLRMMAELQWDLAPEGLPGLRRNGQDRRR